LTEIWNEIDHDRSAEGGHVPVTMTPFCEVYCHHGSVAAFGGGVSPS
jgi:hypothetical protein